MYLCVPIQVGVHFGVDWFWQQVELNRKHVEPCTFGSLIQKYDFINGENNYALAA